MPALTFANLAIYAAQVCVIVGVAGLALTALRPGPRVRLAVLRLVFLTVVLLPLQPTLSPVDGEPLLRGAAGFAMASDTMTVTPGSAAWPWRTWLLATIAAGIVGRAAWLLLGFAMLARLTRRAEPADAHPAVRELQTWLGTRARVCWHHAMPQAVTFGVRPAVVLLPSSLKQAPNARLRAVVCHELLHVQRRDWPIVLVEEAMRTLLWWHPAIWWLVAELQLTREQVIDRQTVETVGGRRDYLDALLDSATAPATLPLLSAFLRRRQLTRRIASLAEEVSMTPVRLAATAMAAVVAIAASSALVVQALPLTADPQAGAPSPRTGPAVVERVDVQFPSVGANVDLERVTVTVRATVDASGRVTSTTLGAWSMRTASGAMTQFTAVPLEDSLRTFVPRGQASAGEDLGALVESVRAMVGASIDAVGQWRFAVPVSAPGTIDVLVRFDPRQSSATVGAITAVTGYGSMNAPAPQAGGSERKQRVELTAEARPALRVGGRIKPPNKISTVAAVYPEDAKAAGIQGVVILEVTIDESGTVSQAHVVRSVPLLDQAALDAVRQWRYEPTLLNGAPVPVIMTVTMNFSLAQ